MPTKGVVVSKQSNSSNSGGPEGSCVDPPQQQQQHREISRLVSELADNRELPSGVRVPTTLTPAMRNNASHLHQEDFDAFFNVDENKTNLENGELTSAQLVSLYMQSFNNLIEYDLDGIKELRDRFVGYFANVLADILEMCYPDSSPVQYVSCQVCFQNKSTVHSYLAVRLSVLWLYAYNYVLL